VELGIVPTKKILEITSITWSHFGRESKFKSPYSIFFIIEVMSIVVPCDLH